MRTSIMAIVMWIGIVAHAWAQLPANISPITDDPRCAVALKGVTDAETALKTGCSRFWAKWPAATAPDRMQQELRNLHLLSLWNDAQTSSRGHYAVLSLGPAAAPASASIIPALSARFSAPPSDVRARCAKQWPDDFAMRAFCEKQQQDASQKLAARAMSSGDQQTIRDKCSRDWPEDFLMRNYCEERQLKALGSLR